MAIVGSGEIKLSDLATEFGGSAPHQMSEYYAGGSNVPSNTGSVPSSGQISLTQFYGTTAVTIIHETNHTMIVNFQKNTYQQINMYSTTDSTFNDVIPNSPAPQIISSCNITPTSGPGTKVRYDLQATPAWDPLASPNTPKFGLLGAHMQNNYGPSNPFKCIHSSPDGVRNNNFAINWSYNPLANTTFQSPTVPYFQVTCSGTNATDPYSIPVRAKFVPSSAPNTY